MLLNRRPPGKAAAQSMKGTQLGGLLEAQPGVPRKPAVKPTAPQRPSAEIVRQLGGGDPAILVLGLERAERFLQRGLGPPVPPMPRVERGQEAKTLVSPVALAAAASGWPLIVSFDGGAGSVTRYAGIDLVEEVLS
jgi:hypothetical protein